MASVIPSPESVEVDGCIILESGDHHYELRGEGSALVLHIPGMRDLVYLLRSFKGAVREDSIAKLLPVPVRIKLRGRTVAESRDGRIRISMTSAVRSLFRI